jgi:hypothetical protein
MAHHHALQPLPNLSLSRGGLFELLPKIARLVSIAAHLTLGLLPSKHGPLQRGIIRLAFESLALEGQSVEFRCLLRDGAFARMSAAGQGERGRAVEVISLLVHAIRRDLEERRAWRARKLVGGIHQGFWLRRMHFEGVGETFIDVGSDGIIWWCGLPFAWKYWEVPARADGVYWLDAVSGDWLPRKWLDRVRHGG